MKFAYDDLTQATKLDPQNQYALTYLSQFQ